MGFLLGSLTLTPPPGLFRKACDRIKTLGCKMNEKRKGPSFQRLSLNFPEVDRLNENPLRFWNEIDFALLVVNCLMCFHWNIKLSGRLSPFTALLHASTRRKALQHPHYLRFDHLEQRKRVRLCISMLNKDSAGFFCIADPLQLVSDHIFQRHQPSRDAKGRGNEKGISLNECPEGLALRVTKKHQQALGGRNQANRASTECIRSNNFTRVESTKKSLVQFF